MKIILTNNTFFPYQRGGAEIIVKRLAEAWSKAGHEVLMVTLKPKHCKDWLPEDTNDEYKVIYWPSNYYYLSNYSINYKLGWHLLDWLGIRRLISWLKVLRGFKPDLVVAHNITGLGFSLHFSCWRLGIPSVQVFHDLQYLIPNGLLMVGQEKKLKSWSARVYQMITASWLGSAKLLVSPSNWLIDCHCQRGWLVQAKWLRLANPGSDSLPANYRLPEKLRRAIFVGQLTKAKGILWLAEQWTDFNRQLLVAGFNEVDLVIVGDGALSDRLKSLADQDQHLVLLGRLPNDQITAQLNSADVLLAPSFCYENWPTVLLEAAAAGCIAISTDQGGGGELAENLGYLTFKAGDLDSLATAWKKLAETAAKINVWPVNNTSITISSNNYLERLLSKTKSLD
jgi:glycosyltransferase involved in cell wall biosynthesis